MKNKINNFWNNKKLSDEEKNEMLVDTCQRLFATDDGKIVLNMLLTELGFFTEANGERERHLNNFAKYFIRERLGVRDEKVLTDFIAETAASGGGK